MPKITATLKAFLPEHNVNSYKYSMELGDYRSAINTLAFTTADNISGWILLGTADITVELLNPEDFVNAQITALKEKKRSIQAETQLKVNEIDHKIQELLCLPSPDSSEEFWL